MIIYANFSQKPQKFLEKLLYIDHVNKTWQRGIHGMINARIAIRKNTLDNLPDIEADDLARCYDFSGGHIYCTQTHDRFGTHRQ
jgi:hypothetical protein